MLDIKRFVFNPFDENTYVVSEQSAGEAVVIDPGMCTAEECSQIERYMADRGFKVSMIVLTHMHLDHCFGVNRLRDLYDVPVAASSADAFLGETIVAQAARFGMRLRDDAAVCADVNLCEGGIVRMGTDLLHVISVPGHSPGGLAFYSSENKVVFTGDSLFRRSIGRTDLPGGNQHQLVANVSGKLLALPGDTIVLPGHGPSTTIAEERTDNPFVS